MKKSKLVTVDVLRKQRDREAKNPNGRISSACSGDDIIDQQIEERKKLNCHTCGNSGTVWNRGPISGCCGEAQSEDRMCPECCGKSSPHFVMSKHPAGFISGWFDFDIRLW